MSDGDFGRIATADPRRPACAEAVGNQGILIDRGLVQEQDVLVSDRQHVRVKGAGVDPDRVLLGKESTGSVHLPEPGQGRAGLNDAAFTCFAPYANPKIAVFFTSLLPQFVTPGAPVLEPFLVLGVGGQAHHHGAIQAQSVGSRNSIRRAEFYVGERVERL